MLPVFNIILMTESHTGRLTVEDAVSMEGSERARVVNVYHHVLVLRQGVEHASLLT